ncbi:unnamed protein product [Meganyctiphanes norvegica]|uniref:Uncharacterized protein n=1 Tax=Meganyctiphanes norvegica TaxID=48144 RepID=A0AAV2PQX6_MEGNR
MYNFQNKNSAKKALMGPCRRCSVCGDRGECEVLLVSNKFLQNARQNNLSVMGEPMNYYEWKNKDDNEIEVHEETVEKQQVCESAMSFQEIERCVDPFEEMSDEHKELLMGNAMIHKTHVVAKRKNSPTVMKLIEKCSQLQGIITQTNQ